jgi:hypothetical protein
MDCLHAAHHYADAAGGRVGPAVRTDGRTDVCMWQRRRVYHDNVQQRSKVACLHHHSCIHFSLVPMHATHVPSNPHPGHTPADDDDGATLMGHHRRLQQLGGFLGQVTRNPVAAVTNTVQDPLRGVRGSVSGASSTAKVCRFITTQRRPCGYHARAPPATNHPRPATTDLSTTRANQLQPRSPCAFPAGLPSASA